MWEKVKAWWHTDCQFCQRTRLLLAWLAIMLLLDYWFFNLIF